MKRFQTWWQGMAPRDRRTVLIGAAIALPLLAYLLIWDPLTQARKQARMAYAEALALYAEAQDLAARIQALPTASTPAKASNLSPLVAVETVAREYRLIEYIQRREAVGAQGVRLIIEDAPAEVLFRMLEALEQQHGLHVSQAQLDPAGAGKLDARLTLKREPG